MPKTRIIVVDDEVSIVKFLRSNLESQGYEVFTAVNGVEAIRTFEMELPDLVILDIMMPEMDGFEVCRRLREWSQVPIIMLSARGDEADKVRSLDLGADDYMTKPFGASELLARVRAVLRRSETSEPAPGKPAFVSGNLNLNFAERKVTVDGKMVKLTPTEYSLLQELTLNAGKVLTHTYLLNKVWGMDYRDDTQYLHVFVRRLRLKVEPDPTSPTHIVTVPGVGYRFNAPE